MAVLTRNWTMADEFTALMRNRAINEGREQLKDIAGLFGALVEKFIAQGDRVVELESKGKSTSATIKFKAQEIAQMGEEFQTEIKATGRVARVIKTLVNGKITYEIRYRRNGYNVSAFSSDIQEVKQKFIQETKLGNIKIGA